MKPHGFSREEHLRKPADFRRVYDRKAAASDSWLVVYGCPNTLEHSRLGLSVSRKWGKAHVRNRVRRLYREAFRLNKDQLPGGLDLVLIPKCVEALTLDRVRASLLRLAEQVGRRCQRERRGP